MSPRVLRRLPRWNLWMNPSEVWGHKASAVPVPDGSTCRCEHLRAKGANSRTHGDILHIAHIVHDIDWQSLTIIDLYWPIDFPGCQEVFHLRASYQQPHAAGVSLRLQGGRTVRYLSLEELKHSSKSSGITQFVHLSLCAAGSCWSDLNSPCFFGSSLFPKCAAVSSWEIRKWKT